MTGQSEEVITLDEVFSNARRASTLPSPMDKAIRIYVEHWVDIKELTMTYYVTHIDVEFTVSLYGILPSYLN